VTFVVSAETRLEAWLDATEHLLRAGPQLNLVLSIASPSLERAGERARRLADTFSASEGAQPLHTVAETIFPGWEYRRRGLRGVFETYAQEYEELKRGAGSRWGTYAHRIVSRQGPDGETIYPLKNLIDKMRDERGQQRRGTYRSCYELGIADGAYEIPLYSVAKDRTRRRGLPCLSHLSFKLLDDAVHLTALYRSHDYRTKTLGNLLGLARLQACVAQEVGAAIGTLVVHSTYAYVDGGKRKLAFRRLLRELRPLAG